MSVTTYTNLPANTNSDSGAITVPAPGRQPDVFPGISRHNLRRATWHVLESKRLILVERRQILHRGTWLALTTAAEVCGRLLLALDRLISAADKEENHDE